MTKRRSFDFAQDDTERYFRELQAPRINEAW